MHRNRSEPQLEQLQEGFPSHEQSHITEAVKSQHRPRQARRCLTEEQEIIGRWAEYCSEFYNHQINGDPSVLTCQELANDNDHQILRQEVEAGSRALKLVKLLE